MTRLKAVRALLCQFALVALGNTSHMDDQHKDIFNFLKAEKLSQNERIQMKNVLLSVMAENPMQSAGSSGGTLERFLSYFDSRALRPVGFAFALVLVVGMGTSYAAEQALPGDPLYAIKVGVTEPIQGVIAVTPVAKAQWSTELLSRRLDEAATLAAKGDLNDTARAAIESQVTLKAKDVNDSVNELKSTEDGTVAASGVESDLEASLVGHERVLTGLSVDLPKQAPVIAPLLNTVRTQAESTNSRRKITENTLSNQNDVTVHVAATMQQKNARDQIKQIRALAASARLHASTTAEASSSASAIETAIQDGDTKLGEGKYGEALSAFQATIRASKAVEVNLNAEDKLGKDVTQEKDSAATAQIDSHQ